MEHKKCCNATGRILETRSDLIIQLLHVAASEVPKIRGSKTPSLLWARKIGSVSWDVCGFWVRLYPLINGCGY